MNLENINEITSVLLEEQANQVFIKCLSRKQFNSARLIIDKKLMELSELREEASNAGIVDPLIEFEYKNCNQIYDYIINEIEESLNVKDGETRISTVAGG